MGSGREKSTMELSACFHKVWSKPLSLFPGILPLSLGLVDFGLCTFHSKSVLDFLS